MYQWRIHLVVYLSFFLHFEGPRDVRLMLPMILDRTGTHSMYEALKMLGYTPFHFAEVVADESGLNLQILEEAIRANYLGECKPYGVNSLRIQSS